MQASDKTLLDLILFTTLLSISVSTRALSVTVKPLRLKLAYDCEESGTLTLISELGPALISYCNGASITVLCFNTLSTRAIIIVP